MIRDSPHNRETRPRLTFILLRGVGLTPLRPLPPPLLTSASSLPICLIHCGVDDSLPSRSHDPENARNHAKDTIKRNVNHLRRRYAASITTPSLECSRVRFAILSVSLSLFLPRARNSYLSRGDFNGTSYDTSTSHASRAEQPASRQPATFIATSALAG